MRTPARSGGWARRAWTWARRPGHALPAPARPPLWALALAVVALTYLEMVRRPSDPPLWDSFYVEDGGTFLSEALSQHVWDSFRTSYLGYLHTVPRAFAEVATWLPLDDAPLVMSLLTTTSVALLSVYVYLASAAWIASPVLRGALAFAFVLAPVTARDIAGNASYVHWYFIYASFWAVLCPWRTRGWLAASTAVVALTVLSDPLCAVLLPLAALNSLRARDRRAWVVPGVIVLGLAAQLVLRDESTEPFEGSHAGEIPRIFAERVTSSLLAGDRYLEDLFGGSTGSPFAWATLVLVAAAVGAGLWRLRGRRAWLLGGCAALSVAFFLIPVLSRGTETLAPDVPWALGGSRYVYLPVMFLLTGLLAAVDRPEPSVRRLPVRELAAAAFVVAVVFANYSAPHRTEGGPRWKPALKQARAECAAGPDRAGRTAIVKINPPINWYVPIRCSQLSD